MKTEIESLNETETWDLVPKEKGQNIIPGRWMYKIKHDSNGNIDKFKARCVAKTFKQIEGIEYSDTFAPTSKPETFKILLALSAIENFFLKQMDVKAAYLHPKIDEEVYLEQPKGFEKLDSNGNKLVCKLKKSIYGLKQAAKNWYQELLNFLIQQGFERSKHDYCLFLKNKENDKLYVLTWIDDLVIAGNSQTEINKLKNSLESKFKMDDRGRSTTGYYIKLGDSGGSVSWQVKKQPTVSLSSCEAEYQGLAAAVQEAIFLRGLLRELGYEQFEPTTIGEDNQSCIKLATNPVLHKRSKHIDTKYHFIRERVDDNSIKLIYTPTDEMAADLLTKSLPQQKVEQHREQLLGESRFLPSGNNLSGGIGAQKRT